MDNGIRKEINMEGSIMDLLILMSEGNPGGLTILIKLMERPNGFFKILSLDDMNIRGSQIWIGYKDYCNEDIIKFIEAIDKRDLKMINIINEEGRSGNHKQKAIHNGASYGRREFL